MCAQTACLARNTGREGTAGWALGGIKCTATVPPAFLENICQCSYPSTSFLQSEFNNDASVWCSLQVTVWFLRWCHTTA